jgi:hypothetical protein
VTSDNPVIIGNPVGEVTFPLSKNVALLATRQANLQKDYLPVSKQFVREINNRTVNMATRYVFFSRDEKWVSDLVNR